MMPVYRREIEHGDTLWVTAHDEQGAIEMASSHLDDRPPCRRPQWCNSSTTEMTRSYYEPALTSGRPRSRDVAEDFND